jgi:lipid-A-disaccharide synthase
MKLFFSVGEPSGDLHGANLIADLKKLNRDIEFVGFGGPKMAKAGCDVLFDLTQFAVMFIASVIGKLPKFLALRKQAADYFETHRPDAVILIDYPGFNWWIARAAKSCGIPVFYYGVPQMWGWLPWRVRKLRRLVDHVLCKLPFEPKWFNERGCHAEYVGHPYFDELARHQPDTKWVADFKKIDRAVLALLPGSRDQEVRHNLELLLNAAAHVQRSESQVRVVVAAFNEKQATAIRARIAARKLEADVFVGKTPELISSATACIACSGSVSLELMYHEKPTVIVYRVNRLKKMAGQLLMCSKYMTLTNLMATDRIDKKGMRVFDPDAVDAEDVPFPEYLTCVDCSPKVAGWISRWIRNPEQRESKVQQLKTLNAKYAHAGASARTARMILKCLKTTSCESADGQNAAA